METFIKIHIQSSLKHFSSILQNLATSQLISQYDLWNETEYILNYQRTEESLFTVKIFEYWHRLPWRACGVSTLETFKTQLDTALGQHCLSRVGGLVGSPEVPFFNNLCVCIYTCKYIHKTIHINRCGLIISVVFKMECEVLEELFLGYKNISLFTENAQKEIQKGKCNSFFFIDFYL